LPARRGKHQGSTGDLDLNAGAFVEPHFLGNRLRDSNPETVTPLCYASVQDVTSMLTWWDTQ
jgi:hypothetical protein